jgi:hypothetical protein
MNLLSLLMVAIVASTIASASASVSDQDKDTLENMHRYGYIKGTGDGSNDSFTFTRDTVSRVLNRHFDPEKGAWTLWATSSAKPVKKFLLDTVIKIRDKFPGSNADARKALFLEALDTKVTRDNLVISGRNFQFKRDDITPAMQTSLACSVYDQLKPIVEEIEAAQRALEARNRFIEEARKAGVEEGRAAREEKARPFIEFANQMIALYQDGILNDSEIDVEKLTTNPTASYPEIIESLKRMGILQSTLVATLASKRKLPRKLY